MHIYEEVMMLLLLMMVMMIRWWLDASWRWYSIINYVTDVISGCADCLCRVSSYLLPYFVMIYGTRGSSRPYYYQRSNIRMMLSKHSSRNGGGRGAGGWGVTKMTQCWDDVS